MMAIDKWKILPVLEIDGRIGGEVMDLNETNYVKEAEAIAKEIASTKLTTTQIRKILTQVSSIYDRANSGIDAKDLASDFAYLRVQLAYQSGRNDDVKNFVKRAALLEHHNAVLQAMQNIGETSSDIDKEKVRDRLIIFCRYMEALVAYFKYYGGKDS